MAHHKVPDSVVRKYLARSCLVKQAAFFAGRHESWLAEHDFKDAQSITDPPIRSQPKPEVSLTQEPTAAEQLRSDAVWSHNLFATRIDFGEDQASPQDVLFACRDCGSYAWKRRTKLVARCPKHATTLTMRQQKERLEQGLFPGEHGNWSLGIQRMLTAEEMTWLTSEIRTKVAKGGLEDSQVELGREDFAAPVQAKCFTENNLLMEFGVDQEDLRWWSEEALAERASRHRAS